MSDNGWAPLDTFAQIRYRVLGFTGTHCLHESPTYAFFRQLGAAGGDMWRSSESRCFTRKSNKTDEDVVRMPPPPPPTLTPRPIEKPRAGPLEVPLMTYLVNSRIQFKRAMCKNRVHDSNEERTLCAHQTGDAHSPSELLAQFNCQVVIDYYTHHLGREIVPRNTRDTRFRCEKCGCARLTSLYPWVQTHDEATKRLIPPQINTYCVRCQSTSTLSVY